MAALHALGDRPLDLVHVDIDNPLGLYREQDFDAATVDQAVGSRCVEKEHPIQAGSRELLPHEGHQGLEWFSWRLPLSSRRKLHP